MTTDANWAGNYTYSAQRLHEPETIDELRRIVANAAKISVLGTRHAFNGIADAPEQLSLAKLDPAVEVDRAAGTVTVGGGVRYGDLARTLQGDGLALANLASLPHISVAGAIATGTHGSGVGNGSLATAVVGLELVTSNGELLRVTEDDPDFVGMVVNLGALGVVTRVTLRVEPGYRVRQVVYEHLPWDTALAHFEEIMAAAYSVSFFTDYGAAVNQIWLKERMTGAVTEPPDSFHGATRSAVPRHPLGTLPAEACTEQLGRPGAWLDRLPHFRMDFIPSAGAEIQSEYIVDRQHAAAALRAIRELRDTFAPVLQIAEIRTIAADDLWLSMAYDADSVGLHFTWKLAPDGVAAVLPGIEQALAPFNPRPHWGKVFATTAAEIAPRYPRMADFRALRARLDPRGAFRNTFLDRQVLG